MAACCTELPAAFCQAALDVKFGRHCSASTQLQPCPVCVCVQARRRVRPSSSGSRTSVPVASFARCTTLQCRWQPPTRTSGALLCTALHARFYGHRSAQLGTTFLPHKDSHRAAFRRLLSSWPDQSTVWLHRGFLELLDSNRRFTLTHTPPEVLSHVLESSEYRQHLKVRTLSCCLHGSLDMQLLGPQSGFQEACLMHTVAADSGRGPDTGEEGAQRRPVCLCGTG